MFVCRYIPMGESNTVVSAYTLYRHLQQFGSHLYQYVDYALAKTDFVSLYRATQQANYGSIGYILSNNRLQNEVELSFDMQKIRRSRKVSANVSLRRLRRLTWADTFRTLNPVVFFTPFRFLTTLEFCWLY